MLERAAAIGRRGFDDFERCVKERCRDLVSEVDVEIAEHATDAAAELGLEVPQQAPQSRSMPVAGPPLRSRRLETQLMTVLGAGFGLGAAVVATKLFAGLATRPTIAGSVAGGVVGLVLTAWVVGARGLLHDRAVLDRWITEVTGAVRLVVEERVATRMLALETALTSARAFSQDARRAAVSQRVAEIDAEVREHVRAAERAEAGRTRAVSALRRELDGLRKALPEVNTTESFVTGR
jgi:hypothetical protein